MCASELAHVVRFPFENLHSVPGVAQPSQRSLLAKDRLSTCSQKRVVSGFPMSTYILPQESGFNRDVRWDVQSPVQAWNVEFKLSLNADRQRISQALTVPEYMEAWFRLPGDEGEPRVTVSRVASSYLLEYQDGFHNPKTYISGTYTVIRRSKMLFTWKKHSGINSPTSLVMVKLIGDFARTTLCLSHTGLTSYEEKIWHEGLWGSSLEKLRCLFQPGSN